LSKNKGGVLSNINKGGGRQFNPSWGTLLLERKKEKSIGNPSFIETDPWVLGVPWI